MVPLNMKICVIGSGVAGLFTTLVLYRRGFNVTLYERAPQIGQGGYAFLLLANGLNVLRQEHLLSEINIHGDAMNQLILKNELGEFICEEKLIDAVSIQRASICQLFQNLIPNHLMKTNHQFIEFIYDADGVATHACFKNGEQVAADLFIAADGARSLVRSIIAPHYQLPSIRIKELISQANIASPHKNTLLKYQHSQGGVATGFIPMGNDKVNWYLQFDSHSYDLNKTNIELFVNNLIGYFPEP